MLLIVLISSSAATAATEVIVSGSTTVMPLGVAASEAFNDQQSEYHVSVSGGGTGGGITNVAEGRSDIAMASRDISASEKSKYGDRFQEFLVGYDGLCIVVSKQVYDAGIKALTKDQVRRRSILVRYQTGTRWAGQTGISIS